MAEHSFHTGFFKRNPTRPFASRLLSTSLIAGGLLSAVLIGATFSKTHRALVHSSASEPAPAAEAAKIVPSDALSKSASWSPLTGDGSN